MMCHIICYRLEFTVQRQDSLQLPGEQHLMPFSDIPRVFQVRIRRSRRSHKEDQGHKTQRGDRGILACTPKYLLQVLSSWAWISIVPSIQLYS